MADCPLCDGATENRRSGGDETHPRGSDACPGRRVGTIVAGKYRLDSLLGVGGMSAVYAAHHLVLDRAIALKVMHASFARDRELSVRFIREARQTAALGHRGFVGVHDAGTGDDGCAYIEMDRLTGCDLLSAAIDAGPFSAERASAIAIAVLDALAALHARGVVHRDLKTSNVFLVVGEDGVERVKLLDLGFARVAAEPGLTTPRVLIGTPLYVSPEQCNDPTDVDARADLFSLGIVLFEILTGLSPYKWRTRTQLLRKVVLGDLERHPRAERPDVPEWLDAIVARSLARDRDARFANADAMRRALEQRDVDVDRPGLLRRLLGR